MANAGTGLFQGVNVDGGLRMRIRQLTRDVEPPVKAVILDMESTNIIDLEGSDELREIGKELEELKILFYLARVKVTLK